MLSIGVTAGAAFRRSGAPGLPDATVGRWPGRLLLTEDSPVAADLFSPRAQSEVVDGVRRPDDNENPTAVQLAGASRQGQRQVCCAVLAVSMLYSAISSL
jgi:hypothetical protein